MRSFVRLFVTLPVLALGAVCVRVAALSDSTWATAQAVGAIVPAAAVLGHAGAAAASADASTPAQAADWTPPLWATPATPDLAAVGMMDGAPRHHTSPHLKSRSAFVYDLDAGEVLVARNADVVRPVASLTKVVASLAMYSLEPTLDREFCIGAEQYPTRSGARSRLSTGDCLTGWDAVGAALVASDNRGAYALAAAAGVGVDELVERMNTISADLAMTNSAWSDPSGLEDENLSTARDLARATVALAANPVLAPVASAPHWDVYRSNHQNARRLFSTARIIGRDDLDVLAAKTGYTDTARYCFTTLIHTATGRRLVITLLGADGKMTRWADVERVLRWVDTAPT